MTNNKKILVMALVVLTVFGGIFAYANTTGVNNKQAGAYYNEEYIKEMEQYRKDADEFRLKLLEEDYKNGKITKSERDLWIQYYQDMEKYDKQEMGFGMGSGCHGGRGMGSRNGGMMGNGMMRGYSY